MGRGLGSGTCRFTSCVRYTAEGLATQDPAEKRRNLKCAGGLALDPHLAHHGLLADQGSRHKAGRRLPNAQVQLQPSQ